MAKTLKARPLSDEAYFRSLRMHSKRKEKKFLAQLCTDASYALAREHFNVSATNLKQRLGWGNGIPPDIDEYITADKLLQVVMAALYDEMKSNEAPLDTTVKPGQRRPSATNRSHSPGTRRPLRHLR